MTLFTPKPVKMYNECLKCLKAQLFSTEKQGAQQFYLPQGANYVGTPLDALVKCKYCIMHACQIE